jgi:hypothetical protein
MDPRRSASTSRHELRALVTNPGRYPLLTLREVRESRLPAVFFDYGEALLYLDDQLFSLERVDGNGHGPGKVAFIPSPMPRQVLESGVGIEHGWRHADGCRCRFCSVQTRKLAA